MYVKFKIFLFPSDTRMHAQTHTQIIPGHHKALCFALPPNSPPPLHSGALDKHMPLEGQVAQTPHARFTQAHEETLQHVNLRDAHRPVCYPQMSPERSNKMAITKTRSEAE